MLLSRRRLVSSSLLLLNTYYLRREIPTRRRAFGSTTIAKIGYRGTTALKSIEKPFEKMEEEGVPKAEQPSEVAAPEENAEEEQLPKLTPAEFKAYNSMAEHMDMFHENFRRTWNMLYTACERNNRPSGMSIRQFLSAGEQFCHHLTVHHTIEEQHIFPVLARRMDAFKDKEHLISQHRAIHEGLEGFEAYLGACRRGEKELRLEELKGVMDGFGEVLWRHLDDEVRTLGAENMRKYWTVEEMRRMPM